MESQSEQIMSNEQVPARTTLRVLRGVVRSVRPQQWVKNAFVLAPLVFDRQIGDVSQMALAAAAFAIFCAISGAVYLLNDLFDVERDRAHPIKQLRPIASGVVPVQLAWGLCATLALGALAASWLIDLRLMAVTLTYFTINVAYSSHLKHVPFIDVAVIAGGFLLRVLAGSFAISVPVSVWLMLCTFLLALFLALGKRQHELRTVEPERQRKVMARYRSRHVHAAMLAVGALTVVAYAAYTLSPSTSAHFGFAWPRLALTIPFTAFGIGRFLRLAHRTDSLDSPTEQMLRDAPFLLNIGGWCVAVLLLVYLL